MLVLFRYLMERKGLNANQILDYLNKKSGILGISGTYLIKEKL